MPEKKTGVFPVEVPRANYSHDGTWSLVDISSLQPPIRYTEAEIEALKIAQQADLDDVRAKLSSITEQSEPTPVKPKLHQHNYST